MSKAMERRVGALERESGATGVPCIEEVLAIVARFEKGGADYSPEVQARDAAALGRWNAEVRRQGLA